MIAVLTKFLGPTNFKCARIKAMMPSGASIFVNWNYALDAEENHREAAKQVVKKNMARDIPFDVTTGWTKPFMVHVVKYHFPEHQD